MIGSYVTPESIAAHEAGHAVACLALGIRLDEATVEGETRDADGVVRHVDGFVRHGKGHPVALSLMTLAGPAAEERYLDLRGIGGVFFAGADGDVEATERFTPYTDLYAFLAVFAPAARSLVALLWPAVSVVADALYARRRLTGEEVQELARGVEGWEGIERTAQLHLQALRIHWLEARTSGS